MLKQLFTVYVRPHLDYAVQVWAPYNQLDINRLERIQFRATRLVHSLKQLDYDQRLIQLGLPTLVERWKRADAILMFKLNTEMNRVLWLKPFKTCQNETRTGPSGSTRQIDLLAKERCNISQREHFFQNRVMDIWNKLPIQVKSAGSKNSFKKRYDDHIEQVRRNNLAKGLTASATRELI